MKSVLLIILALCCIWPLKAQNTQRKDSIMNRELLLEKEYNPTIRDAVKMTQLPGLREPQAPQSKVEFANYTTPYQSRSKLIPLKPQAYLSNLHYSKYRGYLTVGVSSLLDIDGDAGYQILNSDQDRMNIFLSHRSSGCDVSYLQGIGKQRFKINDNWGGLNFAHDFGGINLFADAKYTYSAFNYYGLSLIPGVEYFALPTTDYSFDKDKNQVDQLFEAHVGVSSEKANKLTYNLNIGYTMFQQKYGNSIYESGSAENRILINGDVHRMVNAIMGIGLSGSIKTYSYSSMFHIFNDSTTNYWTYSLKPYLYFEGDIINLKLGVKLDAEMGGRAKVLVSPYLNFNYFPNNQLLLYLLADGGRTDNSQYNMYYENRYVDPLIRVMDSRSPLDATLGIKYLPLATLSIGVFGGYKITKDEHFFYSNYGAKDYWNDGTPMLSGNWITPTYDDANTFKLGADVKYTYQDIFELGVKGTYYYWDLPMDNNPYDLSLHKAWNKPDFEANVNAAYRIPEIPLRFDLTYLGAFGRIAPNPGATYYDVKMNDIHDLSVKGTYMITPYFSLYAALNNLLFSKYDLWWGYPAQDFNIMGGLSILF